MLTHKLQFALFPLVFFLLLILSFGFAFSAHAVTTAQDVTLRVSGSSNRTVTLTSGSTYDTLTVQSGGFRFTLSGTQSVTLRSSSKDIMTNTFGITATCGGSYSEVVLSASKGSTVGVTLEGAACSSGGSGGGGGGGGGSSSTQTTTTTTATTTTAAPVSTPAPAPTPTETTAPSATQTAPAPSTPTVPSPTLVITRPLTLGSTGADVTALQEALATMPDIYPEGLVTGYFGSLSRAAVARFQMKYGLVSSPNDPGYGFVGPLTRAKLSEVFSGAAIPPPAAPVLSPLGGLARELDQGDKGDDVTKLQAFLAQDPELYPEGLVTGYYGSLTTAAVRRFQAKHGISQVGRVGPQTLQKLNEVMGGSSAGVVDEAALQSQIQELQALINSLNTQIQVLQ